MPEISAFYGIVIYMYFSEHNPPHIHVIYQGYKAVITIKDGIVMGNFPRRALSMVFEWLDIHREEIMANWQRMAQREAPQKIEPLK